MSERTHETYSQHVPALLRAAAPARFIRVSLVEFDLSKVLIFCILKLTI